jgi:hypothetical protein
MYTTHITTKDVASAYINSKHGWAVSEQFEDIYEDLSQVNLAKQNYNALKYIRQSLTDLANSGALSDRSREELVDVAEELTQYFQWNS